MLSVTNSPRPATYMPQLDGLRAVAVVCVMVFHFIPWVDRYAPLGTMGVRPFLRLKPHPPLAARGGSAGFTRWLGEVHIDDCA